MKQARSYKQQGKATQHTQGSHFSEEKLDVRVGLEPMTLYTLDSILPAELPRQLSWLSVAQLAGHKSHSTCTSDEQIYHQLSMKEKARVMKPPKPPNRVYTC